MQRVSALLPLWERKPAANNTTTGDGTANTVNTASTANAVNAANVIRNRNSSSSNIINANRNSAAASKAAHPSKRALSWADRIGLSRLSLSPATITAAAPPAALTLVTAPSQMGREAYWPTTLDHECEKAARILKSFCTDGFLDDPDSMPTSPTSRASLASSTEPLPPPNDTSASSPTTATPAAKKKIPPRVIQEAVGLAIFSCMRSGLWMSGSGGSGILIARKADGTWSPPSGIMLHTATLAFVMGVDIYDCVLVINSVAALEMFSHPRLTLGVDVPLTVGPLASFGLLENDFQWTNEMSNTVLTYLKARGRHRPAQLMGSLVTERSNENERFYSDEHSSGGSQPIDILDILAGNIPKSVPEIIPLFEAIKAAEGRIDFDSAAMERLSLQPAPGDANIAETPALLSPTSPKNTMFGVPDASDPDPFGIIALEMAGLEIREAGSKHRPSSNQFDMACASPTSPLFNHFNRQSAEVAFEQGSRTSYMSTRTQATSMNDACTQTDVAETPDTSLSPSHSDDGKDASAAVSGIAPSPMPELSLPSTPAVLASTNDGAGDCAAETQPTIQAYLSAGDHSDSHDDTVASSCYTADDREEDADDEDEETDGLAEPASDDNANEDEELDDDLDDDLDDLDDVDDVDDDEEEPVIFEVATTAARPVRAMPTQGAQIIQAKGSLVTIAKRVPPPLPMRSPARRSGANSDFGDVSRLNSPFRTSFQSSRSMNVLLPASSPPPSARSTRASVEIGSIGRISPSIENVLASVSSSDEKKEVAAPASIPIESLPALQTADLAVSLTSNESDAELQTPRLHDFQTEKFEEVKKSQPESESESEPKRGQEQEERIKTEVDHMNTTITVV